MTYALRALRLALLQGASLTDLVGEILTMIAFCAVLVPLSALSFRMAVRRARDEGSLTQF
jgi:ABC-2 type transport system permease protein